MELFDFDLWSHRRLTEGKLPNINRFEEPAPRVVLESLELLFELCLAAVHASGLDETFKRVPAILSLAMSHPDSECVATSDNPTMEILRLAGEAIDSPNTSRATRWVENMYEEFLSPRNQPTSSFRASEVLESEIEPYLSEALIWIENLIEAMSSEWGRVGSAFRRLTQDNEPFVRGLASGEIERSDSGAMHRMEIQTRIAGLVVFYNELTELVRELHFKA